MSNSKWLLSFCWAILLLFLYVLDCFNLLNGFATGGLTYYYSILLLYLILSFISYFYMPALKLNRVRSLFPIFFRSLFILLFFTIFLSFSIPDIFHKAELDAYEIRLINNGYSGAQLDNFHKSLLKSYYIIISISTILTQTFLFILAILILKPISLLYKKHIKALTS